MEGGAWYSYQDLEVGLTRRQSYEATADRYEEFLKLFGDRSPLHMPVGYARECGFDGMLMHGAMLNGFISHFVGMVLPGHRCLELSVNIRFSKPFYLNDKLELQGKIAQKMDLHQVVVVHFSFSNLTRGGQTATGKVQCKMMDPVHDAGAQPKTA